MICNLGKLMIGTLVLNKQNKIECVESIEGRKINIHTDWGAKFTGKINGKPSSNYYDLPITIPLLLALGWKIQEKGNITIALPDKDQFYNDKDVLTGFELIFVLEDGAVEGWLSGNIITKNGEGEWISLQDFVSLDHRFLEYYSQRMVINFSPG